MIAILKPIISVIILTYNREKFVEQAIRSVLNQTLREFELILVDNGSTEASGSICEHFAGEDERIRLIRLKQNSGASRGRNAGLEAVRCDYLTFVDDDDWCEPQMLEFLWELVGTHRADIAMCGSWNDFDGRKEPCFIEDELHMFDRLDGLRELLKRELYNIAPPTKLFRLELCKGISFPDGVLVDDIHVVYKFFERAQVVAVHNKPLYHFTKHESNMTSFIHNRRITPELLDEYIGMYSKRADYLLERAPELKAEIRYSLFSYMLSMVSKINAYDVPSCKRQQAYMTTQLRRNRRELLSYPWLTGTEREILEGLQ